MVESDGAATISEAANALPTKQTNDTSSTDAGLQHSYQAQFISYLPTQSADAVVASNNTSEINTRHVPSSLSESLLHEETILHDHNSVEATRVADFGAIEKVATVTIEEEEMVLGQVHSGTGMQGLAISHSEAPTSHILTKLAQELDSGNEPSETTHANPAYPPLEPSDSMDDPVSGLVFSCVVYSSGLA